MLLACVCKSSTGSRKVCATICWHLTCIGQDVVDVSCHWKSIACCGTLGSATNSPDIHGRSYSRGSCCTCQRESCCIFYRTCSTAAYGGLHGHNCKTHINHCYLFMFPFYTCALFQIFQTFLVLLNITSLLNYVRNVCSLCFIHGHVCVYGVEIQSRCISFPVCQPKLVYFCQFRTMLPFYCKCVCHFCFVFDFWRHPFNGFNCLFYNWF